MTFCLHHPFLGVHISLHLRRANSLSRILPLFGMVLMCDHSVLICTKWSIKTLIKASPPLGTSPWWCEVSIWSFLGCFLSNRWIGKPSALDFNMATPHLVPQPPDGMLCPLSSLCFGIRWSLIVHSAHILNIGHLSLRSTQQISYPTLI